MSLATAATLLGDSLLYAVLPTIYGALGLELWMVGVLLSANRFVRLLTNALAGRVVERIGVGLPFMAAILLGAATTAGYALGGFALLLVARLLWGLCWSFLRIGGLIAALDAADVDQRGYYLGFFNGTARLGTLTAVLVGGLMTDWVGFGTTTLVFGAATLLAGVALIGTHLPGAEAARGRAPDEGAHPHTRDGARVWALHAAAFLNGAAGTVVVVATLGLLLVERFGTEVAVMGVVLGVASFNGILLGARFALDLVWAPAAGHFSDRLGRGPVLLVTSVSAALALFGLAQEGGLAWTAGLAICAFIAGTALRAALDALAGDLAPPQGRARALSHYATWADLGAATGPFAAYQLVGWIGLEGVYLASACALLGIAATPFVLRAR